MTRRNLMWTGVALLFVLAVVGLYGFYGTHSISLTETQVQERIAPQLGKEFPVKGTARLIVRAVTLKGAAVHIRNGKLENLVDVEGTLRTGKKFTLSVRAIGTPMYSAGAFFFRPTEIQVQQFAYEGAAPSEALTRFAQRYLSNEKQQLLLQDAAPKMEEWVTELAQSAAMHSLEQRPVYRLKDGIKGMVIRAALESVKIDNDRIVVTFSLMQLTLSVALGIVCVLAAIGMVIALLQNPVLGTAVIVLGAFQ